MESEILGVEHVDAIRGDEAILLISEEDHKNVCVCVCIKYCVYFLKKLF